MFSDALTYPMERADAERTVLIGGILQGFAWLLLPVLPVLGYLVAVLRTTVNGATGPPAFDDWGRLTRDGVLAAVVFVAYFLVPTVVTVALAGSAGGVGGPAAPGDPQVAMVELLVGALLAVSVGGLLALAFSYVAVAALANFAREGTLGAAFAFGDLLDVCTDRDYAVGWLVGLGIFLLGGVVSGLVNLVVGFVVGIFGLIPLVGVLVGLAGTVVQWTVAAVLGFYTSVAAYRAYGEGFRDVVGP